MHSLAVWADPGGAVADTPLIFGKAFRADLEPAGAIPTKWLFLLAAMAFKFFATPFASV